MSTNNKMKYKLTFIYCFIVLVLSVLPSKSFPKTEVTNADKIVHFLMYFFMVGVMFVDGLLVRHFDQREFFTTSGSKSPANKSRFLLSVEMTENISIKKLLFFLFFAVVFGAIIEGIQYFLPTRSAEWLDFISNSVGATCGIFAVFLINKLFFRK